MSGRYFRKVWHWVCPFCKRIWLEDFAVEGNDLPIPKCKSCGTHMDGVPVSGEWAMKGCLSVKEERVV